MTFTLPTDVEPTEHQEQADFVRWFRRSYPGVMIYAIPNGGKRDKRAAMSLKVEGVTAGVFDLFVLDWNLPIEMKRQKSGRLSPEQKAFIAKLEELGRPYIVAKGSADAQAQVVDFLRTRTL